MPNSYTKPVSATDITAALGSLYGLAVNLGTADASGTANAIKIVDATGVTAPTTNRLYLLKSIAANTGALTVQLNGGSAIAVRKNPSSTALAGSEVALGAEILLHYDGTYYQLIAGRTLLGTEVVSGFTGTKTDAYFLNGAGAATNSLNGGLFCKGIAYPGGVDNNSNAFCGGSALNPSNGSYLNLYGNTHSTNAGQAQLVMGNAAGSKVSIINGSSVESVLFTGGEIRLPAGNTAAGSSSERWIGPQSGSTIGIQTNAPLGGSHFWTTNGVSAFKVDSTYAYVNKITTLGQSSDFHIRPSTSAGSDNRKVSLYSGGADADPTRGAGNEVIGINATNEAGANIRRSTGKTLAASTSYNLCAVAAKDCGFIRLIDNVGGGAGVTVSITNGAVSGALSGDTTNYTTSAPSSTQCQLSVSGGYLVGTTGSAWTRAVAVADATLGRMP